VHGGNREENEAGTDERLGGTSGAESGQIESEDAEMVTLLRRILNIITLMREREIER
jgi:hypothetical protein